MWSRWERTSRAALPFFHPDRTRLKPSHLSSAMGQIQAAQLSDLELKELQSLVDHLLTLLMTHRRQNHGTLQ